MPLPGFLCIGAQKAGTTWLYAQLIRHPELWMPPVKELHYFDHVHVEQNRAWTTGHIQKATLKLLQTHLTQQTPDWAYIAYLADLAGTTLFTEAWYRRCFERPRAQSRVCCDITPAYSTIGEAGVRHVLALMPEVRVLYVLRDPVQRALSQLRMNVVGRGVQPSESKLLALCNEWDLADRGDYRRHVPPWRRLVPEAHMLFLPYGSIRENSAAFVQRVERFIGVAPFDGYDLNARVHETRKIPIPDSVVAQLTEKFADQTQFLHDEFGSEFAALTR